MRKRSLADMQQTDNSLPCEYNDQGYAVAVLQLEGEQTEAQFDESLAKEAESLGITISRPPTPIDSQHATHDSLCGSANTVQSHHRTAVAVLQLEGEQTEAQFDESLAKEAESLGITISRPPTPIDSQHATHDSLCGSANTVQSHHRTASSGSHGSASTGMTSRSSNEQLDSSTQTPQQVRKRMSARRSLSFTEYEKYLAQHGSTKPIIPQPIPAEPAPSLFSVSTRKSYVSIKNGFKNKFKLRRTRSSQDTVK